MNVIFLAPAFPAAQRQFVRAMAETGVRVFGIGDTPAGWLDDELKRWLFHYEQVPSLADDAALLAAVRRCQQRAWIDRLECTVESIMLPAARAREASGIPGLSVETVTLCRDKYVMKRHLRSCGIPCARNAEIKTPDEARRFAGEVGFPLILKPRAAAGTAGTTRCDNPAELEQTIEEMGIGRGAMHITGEEFISGHEGFWDTLTVGGEVVFESVSHYYPNVLEAMRTRWISPQIVVTNRLWAEGYRELRVLGRKVIEALGIGTAATHMEWFYGPRGLSFSEIGARPPGCNLWDVYCWANDFDLYKEWARGVAFGRCEPHPSRRYAAGLISLRPSQDGHIAGFSGLDEIRRRCGDSIGNIHLPDIGQRTAPVEAGYIAHAYVHVRHPDYDECRRMLDYIGETLKVWAT